MKTYLAVSFGMVAGIAVGGFAVQGLHAEAKPPVYLMTEIDVTDPEKPTARSLPRRPKPRSGRLALSLFLSAEQPEWERKPIEALEGTPPKRIAIQQWESMDAVNKWYNSADYQAALKIGRQYATFRRYAVEGQ